jgi:outer membrane biosynthesis protein TonB
VTDRPGPTDQTDPRQALRVLIERGEGATASATMLRLLWLRQEHPGASVTTETAHLTETAVVIRAMISVPHGGAGSGLAAATVEDPGEWAEAVERAETNAISRALDTLGYVLERANAPRASQPQASPQSQQQAQPPAPSQPAQTGPRSMPPAQPRPTPIQRQDESAPPVVNALRRAQTRPQAVPAPPQADTPRDDDDAPLPEYSWTGFWNAARGFGLDAKKVEEILGRPANQSSPKEAVEDLRAAGAWGPQAGDQDEH